MKQEFSNQLAKFKWFSKKHRLLVAISGGADSVVLAHLLHQNGYKIALAHCNFNLRGLDSQKDEMFCRQLATQLGCQIHVVSFDTKAQIKKTGQSIQMAARELRYNWFDSLLKNKKADYLLTAHQANDVTETMLINLLRGTGIKGLGGIKAKRGKIIRPLLNFTKEEIEMYAKENGIKYRLDKSNLEDKYGRNFIRLKVVPLLKELNPALHQTMLKNAHRLGEENALLKEIVDLKKAQLCRSEAGGIKVDLNLLSKQNGKATVLYSILEEYGFNETVVNDILSSHAKKQSGSLFKSAFAEIALNRGNLILRPATQKLPAPGTFKNLKELKSTTLFKVAVVKQFKIPAKNELYLQAGQLVFPLTLRTWQQGDRFKPFGMKGFKLLSDFMREEKLSAFEKQQCQILVNGNNEVIWVLGRRSDERYRINTENKNLIKLSLAP